MLGSVPNHKRQRSFTCKFFFPIFIVSAFSKMVFMQEEVPNVPKRLVTGTNADLRKLPLKEAKEICRDYGVREEEVAFIAFNF